jgi:tetratricopeptide (TPR) repeat protein
MSRDGEGLAKSGSRAGLGGSPSRGPSAHMMLARIVHRLDRRYLAGAAAGALLGLAFGVPGGYALSQGPATALPTQVDELRLVSLINESRRALALEQPAYAVSLLRAAEALNPRNAALQNNLCAALNGLRRFDEAIAACRAALLLQPDFELARNNLAWAQAERAQAMASAPSATP